MFWETGSGLCLTLWDPNHGQPCNSTRTRTPHSGKASSWSPPPQVHIQTSAPCQVIAGRIRKSQVGTGCVKVQARGCLAAANSHVPSPSSFQPWQEPCRSNTSHTYLGMVGKARNSEGYWGAPRQLKQWRGQGSLKSPQITSTNVHICCPCF